MLEAEARVLAGHALIESGAVDGGRAQLVAARAVYERAGAPSRWLRRTDEGSHE
jgi:hypothetical protein